MFRAMLLPAVLVLFTLPAVAADSDVPAALNAIKRVSGEGKGNEAAAAAWATVTKAGGAALFPTLEAMNGADAVASNWLMTAVDAIAESEAKAGRKLPADRLLAFIKDTAQNPRARRLAFELLVKDNPSIRDSLLAGFVDDPSLEIRRDAIALGIQQTETPAEGSQPTTLQRYRRLFTSARDKDQVEAIFKAMEKLGEKPSITEHYGYVTHWHLIGPFDSTDGKGFAASYPPEAKVDLAAKLKGKENADLAWVPFVTTDRYATVDLNKGLGKHKFATAYAFAVINSEKELPVDVRIASQNAVQIFLNGKKIFQREEYHHGTRMDQHIGRAILKPGANELLVKVCQNNQDQSWAQAWAIQCRLCDVTGGGLPVTQADGGGKPVKLGFTPNPMEPMKGKN